MAVTYEQTRPIRRSLIKMIEERERAHTPLASHYGVVWVTDRLRPYYADYCLPSDAKRFRGRMRAWRRPNEDGIDRGACGLQEPARTLWTVGWPQERKIWR